MGLSIPRVTVHADIDEDVSVGEINTASIGYGLHQAWIYASMFGTMSLFGVTTLANASSSISSVYIVSIFVNFFCLILCGIFDRTIMSLSIRRYPVMVPAVLMSIGTLLILLCDSSSAYALPATVLSGVLTGIGSAMFLLFWGISFARMNLTSIIINTAIAFAIAALVYLLLIMLPAPIGGIASSVLPWLEFLLVRQHAPKPYFERRELPFFNPLPVNRVRFYVAFGTPMLFFGVALGYLRETSVAEIVLPFRPDNQVALMVWALILAIAVLVIGLSIMREGRVEDFLRPIVPFIAVALVFIPLGLEQDSTVAAVVVLSGYFCFEALLWVMLGGFSQRYRLSPVLVYGIGRGALALGTFAGILLTSFAERTAALLPYTGISAAVVLALTCIITGQALLPRERDIRRVILHGDVDAVTIADMLNLKRGDPELDALEAAARKAADAKDGAEAKEAADDGAGNSTQPVDEQDGSTEDVTAEEDLATNDQEEREEETGAEDDGQESESDEDAAVAAAVAPKTKRKPPILMESMQDAGGEGDQKIGYFRRKCEVIANQYLLSVRETEVLFYLAKGYNSAYLQEKLFISEGTAKTHIRHIYGKTNVHSQQQLMRLVNEIRI